MKPANTPLLSATRLILAGAVFLVAFSFIQANTQGVRAAVDESQVEDLLKQGIMEGETCYEGALSDCGPFDDGDIDCGIVSPGDPCDLESGTLQAVTGAVVDALSEVSAGTLPSASECQDLGSIAEDAAFKDGETEFIAEQYGDYVSGLGDEGVCEELYALIATDTPCDMDSVFGDDGGTTCEAGGGTALGLDADGAWSLDLDGDGQTDCTGEAEPSGSGAIRGGSESCGPASSVSFVIARSRAILQQETSGDRVTTVLEK